MPVISIYRDTGEVVVYPVGYPAGMCHKATAPYEEARGGAVQLSGQEAPGMAQQVAVPQQQELKR